MARRKLSSEINVVPYIDVMLVLLIIFMVTAPLLTQGIAVELPKVDSQNIETPQEPVTVSVSADGKFYVSKGDAPQEPLEADALGERIKTFLAAKPDEMLLVEADGQAKYADVAQAMSILQGVGAKRVGFVTKPTDEKK